MKKLVAAAAALVALLVFAPWGFGKLAERHIDEGINRVLEEMPYMAVVERKYTAGWFRSEQIVTFELRNPWTDMLQEVMAGKPAAPQGEAAAGHDEDDADADESAEPVSTQVAPPTDRSARVTVRNEILHGPVLWPFGLGAARVDTHIDWSDEIRKTLVSTFGDDEPFEIATRVGFFGGGTATVSAEARSLKPEEGVEVSWDDFEFNVHFSRDAAQMDFDGEWPRFEVRSEGTHFVMRDFSAKGTAERILNELYDSDGIFRIGSIRVDGSGDIIETNDIEYRVETKPRGDFIDLSFQFGSGPVKSKQFSLTEAHYDFTLRQLHAESLDKLMFAIKSSYARALDATPDVSLGMTEDERKTFFTLLAHDPEFAIDRISLATKSGNGVIKGVLRFKGLTEADFEAGGLAMVGKLEAELDIDVSDAFINDFGGDSASVDMVVGEGYAARKDGRVTSRIEFKAGQLNINGKTQAIPGLGGPPAQDVGAAAGPE